MTWFIVARVGDVVVNKRFVECCLFIGTEKEGRIDSTIKRRSIETAIVLWWLSLILR